MAKPIGLDDLDTRIQALERLAVTGYVAPSFTTAQRDAIVAPATGLTLLNSTTGKYNFWNGAAWVAVTSA